MIDEKKLLEKAEKDIRIGRYSLVAFMEIIKELAEEHNNGWIACSERLPEVGQCVFAQVTSEYQFSVGDETDRIVLKYDSSVARFSWKEIGFDDWLPDDAVIAWQPLPPKYEPKGEYV